MEKTISIGEKLWNLSNKYYVNGISYDRALKLELKNKIESVEKKIFNFLMAGLCSIEYQNCEKKKLKIILTFLNRIFIIFERFPKSKLIKDVINQVKEELKILDVKKLENDELKEIYKLVKLQLYGNINRSGGAIMRKMILSGDKLGEVGTYIGLRWKKNYSGIIEEVKKLLEDIEGKNNEKGWRLYLKNLSCLMEGDYYGLKIGLEKWENLEIGAIDEIYIAKEYINAIYNIYKGEYKETGTIIKKIVRWMSDKKRWDLLKWSVGDFSIYINTNLIREGIELMDYWMSLYLGDKIKERKIGIIENKANWNLIENYVRTKEDIGIPIGTKSGGFIHWGAILIRKAEKIKIYEHLKRYHEIIEAEEDNNMRAWINSISGKGYFIIGNRELGEICLEEALKYIDRQEFYGPKILGNYLKEIITNECGIF